MTPPRLTFSQEELTLQLTGIGAGWTFEQLGQLSLFDEAAVQFPADWTDAHIRVAVQVVQSQWRLRSTTYLEQSLRAGISYSLLAGGSGQMSADTALVEHLMRRPLVHMDGVLTIKLDGEADVTGFSGGMYIGLGIRGQF